MNEKNKQVILLFVITAIVASIVVEIGKDVVIGVVNKEMTTIQKDMENEKLVAKREEEKKEEVNKSAEKDKALSKKPNQQDTTSNIKDKNNTNNTKEDILGNINNKDESLEDTISSFNKEDKTKNHCFNKNGKLYYKGVCIPIPKGFKYLMKEEGFMAYADSSYQKIFMVYVEEHYMDNAKDGLENFTYGIGKSSVIKDGPKNMRFGKNFYQRYILEAQGINTYAFITAGNNKVAFVHVVSADGNVSWAKASLTNLTYYN